MKKTIWELALSENRPEWWGYRACAGKPLELFFPEKKGREHFDYSEGLKLCNACGARDECLEHALAEPELDGLWGGKTPHERQRLRLGKRVFRVRHCAVCDSAFRPDNARQKYCSRGCKVRGASFRRKLA